MSQVKEKGKREKERKVLFCDSVAPTPVTQAYEKWIARLSCKRFVVFESFMPQFRA